ncbi:hypothetical protein Amsp01_057200, partial [Amycolatopsis sp. NBRC 101858]
GGCGPGPASGGGVHARVAAGGERELGRRGGCPVSETRQRLLESLVFVRHQPWRGAPDRDSLLDAVAGLGTVVAGVVRVPHPVEVFTLE